MIFFHSFYFFIYDAVGISDYVDLVKQYQSIHGFLYNSVRTE